MNVRACSSIGCGAWSDLGAGITLDTTSDVPGDTPAPVLGELTDSTMRIDVNEGAAYSGGPSILSYELVRSRPFLAPRVHPRQRAPPVDMHLVPVL